MLPLEVDRQTSPMAAEGTDPRHCIDSKHARLVASVAAFIAVVSCLLSVGIERVKCGRGSADHWIQVMSGGNVRHALVHLPPVAGSSGLTLLPLVVSFHPMAISAGLWCYQQGYNPLADKEGIVVVYPEGLAPAESISVLTTWWPRTWITGGATWNAGGCCPGANRGEVDDVRFSRDLVADLQSGTVRRLSGGRVEIDPQRVYASGGSNGAFLLYRLACQAPDIFAAFVAVAGVLANETRGPDQFAAWPSAPFSCVEHRPVPMLFFYGDADPFLPWGGSPWLNFRSPQDNLKIMKTLNGIPESAVGMITYQNGRATCTSYGPARANVTFCRVLWMGHAWPTNGFVCQLSALAPGATCTSDVDATLQSWEFFKRYRHSN